MSERIGLFKYLLFVRPFGMIPYKQRLNQSNRFLPAGLVNNCLLRSTADINISRRSFAFLLLRGEFVRYHRWPGRELY